MNNVNNILENDRGITLTDNVDFDWIKSITPRYHPDKVKFVLNIETNKVVIGMDVHRDAEILLGDLKYLYGGNIMLPEGNIIYESTLNHGKNLGRGDDFDPDRTECSKWFKKHPGNPRIITDPATIEMINNVLFAWIDL